MAETPKTPRRRTTKTAAANGEGEKPTTTRGRRSAKIEGDAAEASAPAAAPAETAPEAPKPRAKAAAKPETKTAPKPAPKPRQRRTAKPAAAAKPATQRKPAAKSGKSGGKTVTRRASASVDAAQAGIKRAGGWKAISAGAVGAVGAAAALLALRGSSRKKTDDKPNGTAKNSDTPQS